MFRFRTSRATAVMTAAVIALAVPLLGPPVWALARQLRREGHYQDPHDVRVLRWAQNTAGVATALLVAVIGMVLLNVEPSSGP